jgi:hypothetical protein
MAKEKKEKEPKPRAETYESKLAIKGTLDDVVKAAFLKPKTSLKKDGDSK